MMVGGDGNPRGTRSDNTADEAVLMVHPSHFCLFWKGF